MSVVPDPTQQPTAVVFLGRIPPPVTGMTLFTKVVLDCLRRVGPVKFSNWSVGATRQTLLVRARYGARAVGSLIGLLLRRRKSEQRLYMVANSKAGLYFTALLVFAASRMGYTIYLHHHVYSYINRFDRRMHRIDRWLGPRGVHVVHSDKMARDFCNQYQSKSSFAIVYPSAVSLEIGAARTLLHDPIRLGMLSNLTIAKGVGRAIETFEQLHTAGRRVSLQLAGPTLQEPAQLLIDQATTRYPGLVSHLGPLYGADKAAFLAGIDVFLFPTEYEHESWGIVINEALAAGVPVITNDRGCSGLVVGERAGLVVSDPTRFAAAAASKIEHWLEHPAQYLTASRAAIEQADFLNREGQRTLAQFADHMFSPLGSTDGLLQPA
jgi:glycosyltransferase involved in cell wall biosynthesis